MTFRLNEYIVIFGNYFPYIGGAILNGYMTVQEAAEKWGITPRQVQILCKSNRIPGATRMSRIWIIPEDAQKPTHTYINSDKNIHMDGKDK